MRIKLQFSLHHQDQSLMTAAKVHWTRRNQDWQSLPCDNHARPRIAPTRAATRSTDTSPGTFTTRSAPISIVTIPAGAAIVSGINEAAADISGSSAIDSGTKAGSQSSASGTDGINSAGKIRRPSRVCLRQ
ncbi:hypothetical protein FG152_05565 [Ochrobactrum sp. XJ1]|nr:hypothetical protein [Ochrobactrum sp. XJ1]